MKDEIAAAVVFITKIIRKAGVSKENMEKFQNNLTATLLERFKDHWYETVPSRGQGYRCIRINDTDGIDPVLAEAARKSGLNVHDLGLPSELTLWVDPTEVSCRLGENRGAFCTVALFYDGCSENKAKSIDVDEILALHLERKQAEHAKFLKATRTRSRRMIRESSSSRNSPPVPYGACHTMAAYGQQPYVNGNMGWDGFYNGYELEMEEGIHGGNWSNWAEQGPFPQQQQQQQQQRVSPEVGSASPSSNINGGGGGPKKVRMATGGSHLSKQSSHPANKFRWVKQADAAQA